MGEGGVEKKLILYLGLHAKLEGQAGPFALHLRVNPQHLTLRVSRRLRGVYNWTLQIRIRFPGFEFRIKGFGWTNPVKNVLNPRHGWMLNCKLFYLFLGRGRRTGPTGPRLVRQGDAHLGGTRLGSWAGRVAHATQVYQKNSFSLLRYNKNP